MAVGAEQERVVVKASSRASEEGMRSGKRVADVARMVRRERTRG